MRVPKTLKENYKHILLCIACSICVMANNILRENESHVPSLSLHIPGYIVCFCLAVGILKLYFIIKEEEPTLWDPVMMDGWLWRVVLLGFLMAVQLVLRRVKMSFVDTMESALALDIWNAHIPFWTAILAGLLTEENMVYSMGTSLAMTCGLVLMLPVAFFNARLLGHVFGVLQAITIAGVTLLMYQLLNGLDKSERKNLTPYYLLMHLSACVPLFLIIACGFFETPILLEFLQRPFWEMTKPALLHGLSLFLSSVFTFLFFQETPLFFGTVIYCLGNAFTILTVSSPVALVGFLMVMMTFAVHTYIVYAKENESPDKDLRFLLL